MLANRDERLGIHHAPNGHFCLNVVAIVVGIGVELAVPINHAAGKEHFVVGRGKVGLVLLGGVHLEDAVGAAGILINQALRNCAVEIYALRPEAFVIGRGESEVGVNAVFQYLLCGLGVGDFFLFRACRRGLNVIKFHVAHAQLVLYHSGVESEIGFAVLVGYELAGFVVAPTVLLNARMRIYHLRLRCYRGGIAHRYFHIGRVAYTGLDLVFQDVALAFLHVGDGRDEPVVGGGGVGNVG